MSFVRAPEVWFADGFTFRKDGKWMAALRAEYSAAVDMWAWAMVGIQMASGDYPLRARTEFLCAKLLSVKMGVGDNVNKQFRTYKDTLVLARMQLHAFNKGQFSGSPLGYILDRCLTWDHTTRPRADFCVNITNGSVQIPPC